MKGELTGDYLKQMGGLPLIPVGKNKAPLGGKGWQHQPKTAEEIAALNGQCEMAGLLLTDKYVAVDFDGPAVPEFLLEHYDFHTDQLPQTWTVSSGRPGRFALIYLQPDGQQLARLRAAGVRELKNIAIDTGLDIPDPENTVGGKEDKRQQLEIRFKGQQVVVGVHPSPQNLEYQWLGPASPQEIAPLPDCVVDVILQHHCSKKPKARGESRESKPFVKGLPEVTEPRWWEMDHGQRLIQLAERWLPKEQGTGYLNWMHICSLMKACIDQNDVEPAVAEEAFLTFSRRCPGFVSEADVLDKFEAMDQGEFEDPLGLLVLKGQDGELVLPSKPAQQAKAGSSSSSGAAKPAKVQMLNMEELKEEIQQAIEDGYSAADLAVRSTELAAASPFPQTAIKEIVKRKLEEEDAEQDRINRRAALRATAELEQQFSALKLEEFLPEAMAKAIRVTAEGMPYPDHTLLFTFLLGAASVLPMGMKVCMNRRSKFNPPLNLYVAEVGPSGAKKTPKTQRLLKMPTAGVKEWLAQRHQQAMALWESTPKKVRGPRPEKLFIQLDNFTGEALCRKVAVNNEKGRAVLIYREELRAVFDGLGIYKAGRGKGSSGGEEELILELYDGHEHIQVRVSGDREFPACQVSLGGCIQQSVLSELLEAKNDGNGKWARVLFYPLPTMVVPLPDDSDEDAIRRAEKADLQLRQWMNGLYVMQPKTLQCTDEAKRWFAEFELGQQRQLERESAVSARALLNKSAGKVARLAGLFKVLEGAQQVVDLADPEIAADVSDGLFDVEGLVELRHVQAAARLVELSDRWILSFRNAVDAGGMGETVAEVDALESRLQEIALKLGDWQSWKRIKENLTPSQRKQFNAEQGKGLLQGMAEAGLGEVKQGERGGLLYRAFNRFVEGGGG